MPGVGTMEARRMSEVGTWEWEPKTGTVSWSTELYQIARRDPGLLPPRYEEHPQLFTPESWTRLNGAMERCQQTGASFELDVEMVRPDGSTRWVLKCGEAVRDARGNIAKVRGTIQDITERKQAEQAVRHSTNWLDNAARIAHLGAWNWNILDDSEIWSDEQFRIFGLTPGRDKPTYQTFLSALHPEDRERIMQSVEQALAGEIPYEVEFRIVRPSDEVRHLVGRGEVYRDDAGRPIRMVGTVVDITERKRAEEALRRQERELQEAQRVAHVGSWHWEPKTDTVIWSEELYRIACRDSRLPAPSYQEHAELYTAESWNRLQKTVEEALQSGAPYELDLEMVHPDGTTRWIVARGEAVRDGQGNIVELRGTAQDVTDRRRLEEQLLQAQKLEAIGRLAGGVAHDFNNILGVMVGHCELLQKNLEGEGEAAMHATEIKKSAERAAALTRQLLAFSRKQVMQPKALSLNDVVGELSKMLQRLIGENIELVLELAPKLGMVNADPVQIEQVLMNLAVNARDAMPKGGRVTITTANTELDDQYVQGHPPVIPGSYVMCSVTDTGAGMGQHVASRLFEPFFTTKELGKGTGLGLSIIYGIVKQSNGYIWVYSEPGCGSRFKIYLPQVQGSAAPVITRTTPAAVQGGSETILLVEDEDALREMIQLMLERAGYKVLAASAAPGAIQAAQTHAASISLLLTDVMLRGSVNGCELAEQLKSLLPQTRVLYMSGYSESMIASTAGTHNGTLLLEKPFSGVALLHKVREVLEQRS